MAISYNAGTGVLTVTGAGNTFAAIYAADVAGGWGVVTNQGNQYYLNCYLDLGDGSTVTDLTDNNVHVQIGTAVSPRYLKIYARATYEQGTLSNGTYTTDYGTKANALTIYQYGAYVDVVGTWKLYGCTLTIATATIYTRVNYGTVDFRNCAIGGAGAVFFYYASGQIRRCTMTALNYGLLCYTQNIILEDIVIESPTYGMVLGLNLHMSGSDIKIHPSTTTDLNIGNGSGMLPSYRLTDCEYDEENVYTYSADRSHLLDRKTLEIEVLDEQGSAIEGAQIDMVDNVDALFTDWDVGLLGYWKLWGDGEDIGGSDYDFTSIVGATSGEDRWGKDGRAMIFDGSDYMDTTQTGIIPTGDFSVAMWAKVATGATYNLLAHYNTASPYTGIRIGNDSANNALYVWMSDGVAGADASVISGFADNTWHHVVITVNNSTKAVYVYFDGKYSTNYTATRVLAQSTNPIRLGRGWSVNNYLTGGINELMIWSKVLTAYEVLDLYCYQKPWFETDASGLVAATAMQRLSLHNNGAGNGKGATYNTIKQYTPYRYVLQAPGFQTVQGDIDLSAPAQLKVAMKASRIQMAGQI